MSCERRAWPGKSGRYTALVPKPEPHEILGVDRQASAATIKAAWRRLAREHHPDVSGPDTAATRAATRRMAEINAAYEQLVRDGVDRRHGSGSSRADSPAGDSEGRGATAADARARTAGPPRPRPTRPVTGRLDTTPTYRARNSTTGPRIRLDSPPRGRAHRYESEPPRASDPTGPLERGRLRRFRRPIPPTLEDARARVMEFGKFHGHTLAEIVAFEPSYIDWLAQTISRDPDLVAAARVIRDDLDVRQIARRAHPDRRSTGRTA